ncbi:hypothetical protein VKT23_000293 [Stygiomarasmius scandens]|uniref:Uncharacterized protein n=1 Tax=Marasmiellus scandens TaxID=2682957 RepID=A0ABR1K9M8_9AGAR
MVPGAFSTILAKAIEVEETTEFWQPYSSSFSPRAFSMLRHISSEVMCYRGDDQKPEWTDVDVDKYSNLCTIEVDIASIPFTKHKRPDGREYYRLDYSIVLSFGLTELQAQYAWIENGVEKRGPAEIVYDDY